MWTTTLVLWLAPPLGCTIDADAPDVRQYEDDEPSDDEGSDGGESSSEGDHGETACGDEAPPPTDPACDPADPCAGFAGVGRYYIDRCGVLGGSVIGDGITCDEAFATCLLNETDPDAMSVHCEWNGILIHRSSTFPELCDAEYGPAELCAPASCGAPCSGREGQLGFVTPYLDCEQGYDPELEFPVGDPIGCTDALAACTELADAVAEQSFVCRWNDEVLVWREVTPGECAGLGPAPVDCDGAAG